MEKEVELKLELSPECLDKAKDFFLKNVSAPVDLNSQQLLSTYYDTSAFDLKRLGISLRIRNIDGQLIQTVKVITSNGIDHAKAKHHRYEYECALERDQIDLERIPKKGLKKLLKKLTKNQPLQTQFTTEIHRELFQYYPDDNHVEIAFDNGAVRNSQQHSSFSEIELELKKGEPSLLLKLALELLEIIPCRLEQRTKADRGYHLNGNQLPKLAKAEALVLSTEATIRDSFEVIALSCLTQLRANELAFRYSDDPEVIHQLRVAVRRLRAAVSIFKPLFNSVASTYLAAELKWLQNELGPARDWDVFLLETAQPLSQRLQAIEDCETLLQHATMVRNEAYARAEECLSTQRFTRLLLNCYHWFETGQCYQARVANAAIKPFADKAVYKREHTLKRLGQHTADLDEAQLHQVRIAGKKLRYALEFFSSIYTREKVTIAIDALKQLQDTLGALNDAAAAHRLMEELYGHGAMPGAGNYLTGLVDGWLASKAAFHLNGFSTAWENYLALSHLGKRTS